MGNVSLDTKEGQEKNSDETLCGRGLELPACGHGGSLDGWGGVGIHFGGQGDGAGSGEADSVRVGCGGKGNGEAAGVTWPDGPGVCDKKGIPLGRGSSDGGDGDGSGEGGLAGGGVRLCAKACIGRSGLGMTGLAGRVMLGGRDGRDSGNGDGSREGDSAGGGIRLHAKA